MIFDTIYEFYLNLFASSADVSEFWANWSIEIYNSAIGDMYTYYPQDYFSAIATFVTIVCGIFALFRILGGVLKLFKV